MYSMNVMAGPDSGRVKYNASTGDTRLDVSLANLDIKANGNINDFISALGIKYKVPTTDINNLIVDYGFSPSETYMAVSIGSLTNHTITEVADLYKENKSRGWGNVARSMGIKPGSREFHQLKNNVDLDQDNSKKEKGNGKGKNKSKGKDKNKPEKHARD